jgi:Prefoldin subunit
MAATKRNMLTRPCYTNRSVRIVEDTLKPLDPERRAFRLVGGILVERTVKEVLPSVTSNRENVSTAHYW